MTNSCEGPAGAREAPGAAGPGRDEEVDVRYLGGQRLPAGGAWLLVTAVDGNPGAEFTAHILDGGSPSAFGGDVVIHLAPGDPRDGPGPGAGVQVYAVMGGRLIPVAAWQGHDLDGWPERIRPTVAFAMGVLTELDEHGAQLGAGADLAQASAAATAGVPLHITFAEGTAAAPMVP